MNFLHAPYHQGAARRVLLMGMALCNARGVRVGDRHESRPLPLPPPFSSTGYAIRNSYIKNGSFRPVYLEGERECEGARPHVWDRWPGVRRTMRVLNFLFIKEEYFAEELTAFGPSEGR